MVSVKITITSKSAMDRYGRYHGLTVDTPLHPQFWSYQTGAIIGVSAGKFRWSKTFDLTEGNHYLIYQVSSFVGLGWVVFIKAGYAVPLRIGITNAGRQVKVPFRVTPIITRPTL